MKKGFTLVEILAVIAILGILALITVPTIDSIIKKNKEDLYKVQKNLILSSLKSWANANAFILPSEDGEVVEVTLAELKLNGFIQVDVRNPETNDCFSNDLKLFVKNNKGRYEYIIDSDTLTFYEANTCDVE